MCTPELQKKLLPMREAIKEEQDKRDDAIKQVNVQTVILVSSW